jgi:SAM-dependent methyltransferase
MIAAMFRLLCRVVMLSWAATQAMAQVAPQDAPFVPTPQPIVEAMLQLANVTARDVVYDLGSGDGRIVITAAKKFGARSVGVELDPHLIIQSEESARQAGVERLTRFLEQDLFKVDLSPATVITLYLWPRMYDKLAPGLARLRPGTRIVIYRWGFTEWKPDRREGGGDESYFLYLVPAQVGGRWRVSAQLAAGTPREYQIEFRQRYQEIRGEARDAAGTVPVSEARLEGDRIRFVLGEGATRQSFEGQVAGNVASGVVRPAGAQAGAPWRAEQLTSGERRK